MPYNVILDLIQNPVIATVFPRREIKFRVHALACFLVTGTG